MTNNQQYTSEEKFCVKYLLDHGIDSKNFTDVVKQLRPGDTIYDFVKSENKAFFDELAAKLRELWPPGEKCGKWPWRESVSNVSKRLEILWKERMREKTYTVEQCLAAARKYLAQFESDTTYMMLLKYFIMKQDQIVKENGHVTYVIKSTLADMLESDADFNKIDDEWNTVLNDASVEEGELI